MEKQALIEGMAVLSAMGHDTGKSFVVISIVNNDFVLIANGKSRPLGKPKLKRIKHLKPIQNAQNVMDMKGLTDAGIIGFLKKFDGR